MWHCWRLLLFVFWVSLVSSVEVQAQPIFGHAESIEYVVANADVVVIGELTELGDTKEILGSDWRQVTIAAKETLKGDTWQPLRVHVPNPESVLSKWKDGSHRLLVAIQHDNTPTGTVIDLTGEKLEVATAELKFLRKPEDVIRIARETVRRMPGVRRTFGVRIMLHYDAIGNTQWAGNHGLGVIVPVDDRLEMRAHEYICSDDSIRRSDGIKALRFFKSDENIARLKTLLDDPDTGYLRHPVNNMGVEVRQYSVRKEAFETLEQWGVKVKKPIIRVETFRPDEVTLVAWSEKSLADGDLKKLKRFENLTILLLNDTNVTDTTVKELCGLKRLRELRLSGTKVTDNGIKQLAELQTLQYLSVVHTKVTNDGIAELRKLRPELKIEH
jgi:hypothetical protein